MRLALAASLAAVSLTLVSCSDANDTAGAPEAAAEATEGAATTTDAAPAAETGQVLDANSATAEQLTAAQGMTPELAAAIVAGRPYAGAAALNTKLRETLNEDAATAVLQSVFVPVNLNSASREDIALIPGMTDKMIHEFLEYRPYADMAEFDREIGKYVDAAEVARLRRYVTL